MAETYELTRNSSLCGKLHEIARWGGALGAADRWNVWQNHGIGKTRQGNVLNECVGFCVLSKSVQTMTMSFWSNKCGSWVSWLPCLWLIKVCGEIWAWERSTLLDWDWFADAACEITNDLQVQLRFVSSPWVIYVISCFRLCSLWDIKARQGKAR